MIKVRITEDALYTSTIHALGIKPGSRYVLEQSLPCCVATGSAYIIIDLDVRRNTAIEIDTSPVYIYAISRIMMHIKKF